MHESVLLKESIDSLHIQKGGKYIDATLGGGGHTLEIVKRDGRVLGIEADPKMLAVAKRRTSGSRPVLVLGNFRDIASIAKANGFEKVLGVLFDLGISSVHLDSDDRGFSFRNEDVPLDMRLDQSRQGVTASDLLNSLNTGQLTLLFESKRIAEAIVAERRLKPFEKVSDFLGLFGPKTGKIHPATKAFMMLRIAVNSEYENLEVALSGAFDLLLSSGKLVVISFHSGEDRIVKRLFREFGESGRARVEKLILPTLAEVKANPRSRSAKMRVLTKT
jgi:16S rRNA (cytosine1402-N4)-methyltransferase